MFVYGIENFMTSFLRHAMWFRALASMPLTHIIPCRVSNMYNTRNRVILHTVYFGVVFYIVVYHLSIAKSEAALFIFMKNPNCLPVISLRSYFSFFCI